MEDTVFLVKAFLSMPFKKYMKRLLVALLPAMLLLSACNGEKNEKKAKDNYEKGKLTLEEIEQKSPEKFLVVGGKDKKNLLGQTVIKATIINNAKVVSYKDIDIKLSFYSKTGALLEEDHEVVYETVAPGASVNFKSKYFAAKGTDSVGFKVVSAKY